MHRARDLADIVDLAEAIPLDKSFTPRVDPAYRADFKRLIDDLLRERAERADRAE